MSGVILSLLDRYRLVLTVSLMLALSGLVAWFTMPRQEDPAMPDRFGIIIATYPGADAEAVERLVAEPIEEHLAQVGEIFEVTSTARTDVVVLQVRLADEVYATREAWDEVEEALKEAQDDLPDGAGVPTLEHKVLVDQQAVVLAVTGGLDRRALLDGARSLKKGLLQVPGVSEVHLIADPGEQVLVEYDEAQVRRLGLPAGALAAALAGQNASLPAGVLAVGGRNTAVRAEAELRSVEDLANTELRLPSGAVVPLSEVARVRLGPAEPGGVRMRFNGAEAVGVAVVPKADLDVVKLGAAVRARVAEVAPGLAPLQVEELSYLPDYVSERLSSLGQSLLLGVLIVAAILILFMGPRLGLVVSAVVPLVALAALAVYALGGGVLHQISVAALILALGMLVDNAIVVAEAVQVRMDHGMPSRQAAVEAVQELALPLATATGTTLAAFVPMYMSRGSTGDFTRAIPIVLMLTLTISYIFAVLVTPNLACRFLRARPKVQDNLLDRLARRAGAVAIGHPWRVVAAAAVAVILSGLGMGKVDQTFFPASGRDQLVVEVVHPEGTHLDETDASARTLEQHLLQDPRVRAVSSFVGRSAPRFYYNLPNRPESPHFAHVVVRTHRPEDVDALASELARWARRNVPEAEVIPRPLEQGPPVAAPLEIRLHGEDLAALGAAAEQVMAALRRLPETRNVTQNQGLGVPAVEVEVHDGVAARRGLARRDVALALLAQTRGVPVGSLRSEEDPIPIVVRSAAGERLSPERLGSISVPGPRAQLVPLAQVATPRVRWRPAAVHHRDRVREVAVFAHLEEGATFGPVLAELQAELRSVTLPDGVQLSYGGAARGSGEANTALARTAPLGALLLLLFLLVEFNSFRRVFLVLLTVPLAVTGVVPGLLVAQQPFGFMSLLGVIALVGVVVNNAIVLIDVVETRRKAGVPLKAAVAASVQLRARPILLTTGTTVAGLLPLALSSSPLWPPLASAMIAGLLASTFLTLVVVPAAYVLIIREPRPSAPGVAAAVACALLLGLGGTAQAAPGLSEVLTRGAEQPAAVAAAREADAAQAQADATWRQAFLPTLGAEAGVSRIDRLLSLQTPVGSFPFGSQSAGRVGAQLTQPILDLGRLLGEGPAASLDADAARLVAERRRHEQAGAAGARFLDVHAARAARAATEAFVASLEARSAELTALASQGRALEADQLRVALALADAQQGLLQLDANLAVARRALGEALGEQAPVDAGALNAELSLPPREAAFQAAVEARPDLQAILHRAEAAQRRGRGVWAELMPRLEARAQFIYDSGLPYDTDHYFVGSLNAVWRPFLAGTRFARADAQDADAARWLATLDEAQRGVRVQVEAAYSALDTAEGALAVARRAVTQAEENARVERIRYQEGAVTMSDLLEAEALLREHTTRRAVAEVEVVRARLMARLAVGDPSATTAPPP